MKKINLLLVLALVVVFAPTFSSAEQERKGLEGEETPNLVLINEEKEDGVEFNEQERNREKELEMKGEQSSSTNDIKDSEGEDGSVERKSRVANAVQEMLQVADRTGGLGEQIRVIAQEQKENYEKAEEAIMEVSKRGGFSRFFIGPNFSLIKDAEKYTEQYTEKLQKMQEIVQPVTAQDIVDAIDTQIKEMEQVKVGLEAEIETQKGGFSLFGWLGRLLNK